MSDSDEWIDLEMNTKPQTHPWGACLSDCADRERLFDGRWFYFAESNAEQIKRHGLDFFMESCAASTLPAMRSYWNEYWDD